MDIPAKGLEANSDGGVVDGIAKGAVVKLNHVKASLSLPRSFSRDNTCE
jgi:hypothetical protein